MSKPSPTGARDFLPSGGAKAVLGSDISGLLQTLQGHVDDLRTLIQCGICIRPLYEPYTLACGHTFCYGCLSSWFAEGRSNHKTCPDCRTPVKAQPAPAYLVRAVVQMFTSRAELLEKGETTDQHKLHQREEAERLEADKKNTDPREGGLFKGTFNKSRHPILQPIVDLEDNVVRCPQCSWELPEDSECTQCGYRRDLGSMSDTDWGETESGSEMTEDTQDFEDMEDGFGEADDFYWNQWYENVPLEGLQAELRHHLASHSAGMRRSGYSQDDHSGFGSHDDIDDDDDDDDDDEDMRSFIDDDEIGDEYSSDSSRSTIVGASEYGRQMPHPTFDSSSEYSVDRSGTYDEMDAGFDSEDEDEEGEQRAAEVDDEDEEEEEEDEEENGEDEDEEEQPIRPPININRRRIPQFQVLSSSPARATAAAAPRSLRGFGSNSQIARRRERPQPPPQFSQAGSSAFHAIDVEDDSDEGPVGPVRRARDRRNCWPAAS